MANKKLQKGAFIANVIAMILSVITLIGTSFAWFTDSVTNTNNVINSGNLDVELWHCSCADSLPIGFGYVESEAEEVGEATSLFLNKNSEQVVWEPGAMVGETFRIKNMGNLALKYEFKVKSLFETMTEDGKKLSDVLRLEAIEFEYENGIPCSPENGLRYSGIFNDGYVINGSLLAGETVDYWIGIDWTPTANDNDYNVAGGLSMTLAVDLVATQASIEEDGFNGTGYDDQATFPEVQHALASEEIAKIVKQGGSVILSEDVVAPLSYSAIYGTPVALIQKGGVIDGNGNSLEIIDPVYNGFAIETWGGTIKNLIIDSTVGRGIVISSPVQDVYLENVIIDGPGYAINTTEHNAKNLFISSLLARAIPPARILSLCPRTISPSPVPNAAVSL